MQEFSLANIAQFYHFEKYQQDLSYSIYNDNSSQKYFVQKLLPFQYFGQHVYTFIVIEL
jgi:hypothetical protein